jgi:ERCC4-related helicase
LPEVDVIVNYSVPLDENTMLQRRGRVGRSKVGYIHYLMSDYAFDTALFYSNLARARQMRRVLEAKDRGERLPIQGELFP